MYQFSNLCVDVKKQLFWVDSKSYNGKDIQIIHIVYEQASFKGKSKPFVHTFIGGSSFLAALEPKLYVGLKIVLKDGEILLVYVSQIPVLYNSDLFLKDVNQAKRMADILNKCK